MQLLAFRGPPSILAVLVLFSFGAAATAAEIVLESQIDSEQDLSRVTRAGDGTLGVVRLGTIDFVQADGAVEQVARASEGQTVHLGDGAEYYGICTHRAGAADFAPTATFELHDRDGTLAWDIGATEDVGYAVSRAGAVVGMSLNINVPERNRLHFYDDRGQLEADVAVPYLTGGRFDPDGRLFFALSTTTGLLAFDRQGAEIYRVPGVRMFAPTPGGARVAIIGAGVLQIVEDGQASASANVEGLLARRLAIAPDGSRVALATKHEIRVYETARLDLLLAIPTEETGLSWTSVDIASANGWLVAGLARDLGPGYGPLERHPAGEVRAYDARGRLAHTAQLEFPIWNIWTPTTILDADGSGVTVTTRRAVYRTVLP